MSEHQQRRISVTPTPSDAEMAAIAAAVVASTNNVPEDGETAPVNKWREAGKLEALREHTREIRS